MDATTRNCRARYPGGTERGCEICSQKPKINNIERHPGETHKVLTVPDDPTHSQQQHDVRPEQSSTVAASSKATTAQAPQSCCWHIISHRPFRLIGTPARGVIG